MAATNRLFVDFLSGTTDADPGSGGTTLSGAFLADLPEVADPDFVALVLDPEAADGDPEVVWVTAHTASATTATVERGKEGSTARAHDSGSKVVAALTAGGVPAEVDDGQYVDSYGSGSVSDAYSTAASVTLEIPASWNSWKCVAQVGSIFFSSNGTDEAAAGEKFQVQILIDGVASDELAAQFRTQLETIAYGARRTGITTTGSRTVEFQVKHSIGDASFSVNDTFLYARAVRTS